MHPAPDTCAADSNPSSQAQLTRHVYISTADFAGLDGTRELVADAPTEQRAACLFVKRILGNYDASDPLSPGGTLANFKAPSPFRR